MDLDLLRQIRKTSLHLLRRWRTVAGTATRHVGPAFQNIRDVNFRAREPHRLDNFRQQLSRASHERLAARIFIRPRRFADEHQFRVRIADTENGLGARAGEMRAFRADGDARLDRSEQRRFVRDWPRRRGRRSLAKLNQ